MSHTYAQLCIADYKSRDYDPSVPSREGLDAERPLIRCWHCGELKALRFANDVCKSCKEDWEALP